MSMNIQQYRIATDEEVKWFLNATYDDDVSDKWFDDFTKSKQEYKLAKKHNLFIKKPTEFYAESVEGIFNLNKEPPTYMAHVKLYGFEKPEGKRGHPFCKRNL